MAIGASSAYPGTIDPDREGLRSFLVDAAENEPGLRGARIEVVRLSSFGSLTVAALEATLPETDSRRRLMVGVLSSDGRRRLTGGFSSSSRSTTIEGDWSHWGSFSVEHSMVVGAWTSSRVAGVEIQDRGRLVLGTVADGIAIVIAEPPLNLAGAEVIFRDSNGEHIGSQPLLA
jgi:hypothetical protein